MIDEYDVPLDKVQHYGYYSQIPALIRSMFGQALKSNSSIFFAVMTGCLRVSRESVFNGLNNLRVLSIGNVQFSTCFGFTDEEIRHIFVKQIMEWFREESIQDTSRLDAFCDAFAAGDAPAVESGFNAYLARTISIRDTGARKDR